MTDNKTSAHDHENKILREALVRIRETCGHGAADIVVANTMLGRIDQLAREALKR
jgi:hypothetical protein